jgi:hypothetical protein
MEAGSMKRALGVLLLLVVTARAVASQNAAAEQRRVATMKFDLRNLVTAEEAYFADSVKYTADLTRLRRFFHPSAGIVGLRITLTPDGWGASVGHQSTDTFCAIYVGSTPTPPARKEGEPLCQAGGAAEVERVGQVGVATCGGAGGRMEECDDQADEGEAARRARLALAKDWADSVAVLATDEFGLHVVESCRACTRASIDSATWDYARRLRNKYPLRPTDIWRVPRLEIGEADAPAAMAALPVSVSFRRSLVGQGIVAQFRNLAKGSLTLTARFTNPATAESRLFTFTISEGGLKEFGYVEGWVFASGHRIELSGPGYQGLTTTVP